MKKQLTWIALGLTVLVLTACGKETKTVGAEPAPVVSPKAETLKQDNLAEVKKAEGDLERANLKFVVAKEQTTEGTPIVSFDPELLKTSVTEDSSKVWSQQLNALDRFVQVAKEYLVKLHLLDEKGEKLVREYKDEAGKVITIDKAVYEEGLIIFAKMRFAEGQAKWIRGEQLKKEEKRKEEELKQKEQKVVVPTPKPEDRLNEFQAP